jgi:hypothetical protein
MRAIVGSSDLWLTPDVTGSIVAIIATCPAGEPIGIRMSRDGLPASPVEKFTFVLTRTMGREILGFTPDDGGRGATFKRDYELVEHAEAVYAFFSPGNEMEGGTGHVVKSALDREVSVEAYGLDDNGELTLIGSDSGNPFRPSLVSRPEVLLRMWEEAQGA